MSTEPWAAPKPWVRDLAIVGALSGFGAPIGFTFFSGSVDSFLVGFALLAGGAGAISGALVGAIVSKVLRTSLGRHVPISLLTLAGVGLGSIWGGLAATAGALSLDVPTEALIFSGIAGGFAGAVQLGWFWFAYLLRRIKSRSTWPLILATGATAHGLAWIGMFLGDWVTRLL